MKENEKKGQYIPNDDERIKIERRDIVCLTSTF